MKHDVSALHTRPTAGLVTIRHRDEIDPGSDEFLTNTGELKRLAAGIGRTPLAALPDHVGVCEIVDVGPAVTSGEKTEFEQSMLRAAAANPEQFTADAAWWAEGLANERAQAPSSVLKQGDVCMLDFYETRQPFVVDGESLFLADAKAMRCWVDPKTCEITPLPQYVLTKTAPERMARAYFGTEKAIMPQSYATFGIPGRKIWSMAKQAEVPCFFIVYEEVVALGSACVGKGIEVGDLVMVVCDFAMKFRAGGTQMRLTELGHGCMCAIDDEAVATAARARKREHDPRDTSAILVG